MIRWLRNLSVRVRLSAAITVLFALMLLVSLIGMRVLNRTELWMNVLHQDTLTEVSAALDLSRDSSDLATSAPFLFALFPPFQLEREAASVRENLRRIAEHSEGDPELDLPVARLRLAIDDLTTALSPQAARKAALAGIDRDMVRLNQRVRRLADDTSVPPEDRERWASLQQLTFNAIGAARADGLIELGEFTRRYAQSRDRIAPRLMPIHRATFEEIEQVTQRSEGLFVIKHRDLAAQLDAENALFRIRQGTSRISTFAETKVAQAQARLSQARAQTSNSLEIAKNFFLALILASLLVAVTSSLYVSRYVAGNLERIAQAMRKLASGNLRADLPQQPSSEDEIGQLFAAFQVFRENARKLDRRTGQIRHQNALFSRVFRNIKDGVAIASAAGWIDAENDNLRQLLRLPPASEGARHKMKDLIAQSNFTKQTTASERGGFEEYADPHGNSLEMRHSPLPDGGRVWLVSETTERKRVEARLEEIRRVEALGKVSGEVAHDFGNILSSISGNLHLMETADPDRLQDLQDRIGSAVDLGVSLTERLLAFARKQHLEPQVTDIGMLVEGMADLLEIAVPSNVALAFEIPATPILSLVDPGQLESAILNLCVNAGQAIDGAGTIRISLRDADGAELTITDTGNGMTADVLRHATEPFFSSRHDGSGTGLGLSMVDGFVHQSGGRLTIASRTEPPKRGTSVTLSFPPLPDTLSLPDHIKGEGSALVVDDDPAYLVSTSDALERLGYAVLQAASYSQAVDLLRTTRNLDLVLSDLNLDNGASGWELLQFAQQLFPECRLILMSTRETRGFPGATGDGTRPTTLKKPLTEAMIRSLFVPS